MKVGIMQPYVFPYIGYYQLIQEVDCFIILDNVSFIKGGWINRNRILVNNEPFLYHIPLQNSSSNTFISKLKIVDNLHWKNKLLKTLFFSYQKAFYFQSIFPHLEEIFNNKYDLIVSLNLEGLRKVFDYLGHSKEILIASNLTIDHTSKGIDRVISLVKAVGGHTYINLPGAADMYKKSISKFEQANLELQILHPNLSEYPQFKNDFIAGLSIIDVLMFNSKEEVKKLLTDHKIEHVSSSHS